MNSHFDIDLVQPLEHQTVTFLSKFKFDINFGEPLEMVSAGWKNKKEKGERKEEEKREKKIMDAEKVFGDRKNE